MLKLNQVKLVKSKFLYYDIMKFDDFWNLLVGELATSKQLTTQTKPFSAKYSGGRIMVSTSDTCGPSIGQP